MGCANGVRSTDLWQNHKPKSKEIYRKTKKDKFEKKFKKLEFITDICYIFLPL